ncbi:MAG TPA: SAM-dependent methyltransferase [Polyangiales bacterium]|nr:SAM-dependent methyltransferase [Polyangiales bacterium]
MPNPSLSEASAPRGEPTESEVVPPDEPVASAEHVAWVRALAHLESDVRVRNPDFMAQHFVVNHRLAAGLRMPRLTRLYLRAQFPGFYYYHTARTKFLDDVMLRAERPQQLLILGAGYDSRPYRFQSFLHGVRIFELDYPSTQAAKQQRLREIYGAVPEHVTFVPIDFKTLDIAETLKRAGFRSRQSNIVLWEGVTMYLTGDAVDAVLRFVVRESAPGSVLGFDYVTKAVVNGDLSAYGARSSTRIAAKLGEPYTLGLDPQRARGFLERRGLRVVRDLDSDQLEQEFLGGRGAFGARRVWGFTHLMHAEVA